MTQKITHPMAISFLGITVALQALHSIAMSIILNFQEFWTPGESLLQRNTNCGGSGRESNPPIPVVTGYSGFEVRESHRAPSTPVKFA